MPVAALVLHLRNTRLWETGFHVSVSMDPTWQNKLHFFPMHHLWFYLPSQLGEVATESELYRFIAQSSRAFDQAIYAKFQEQCPSTVEDIECSGPHSEGSPPCNPHPKEVWEATVAVLDEGNFPEFESLQKAAER